MNSKYRDFMQRQNMEKDIQPQDEDKMRQLFGNSPDNHIFTSKDSTSKKEINVEEIPLPIKANWFKKGFVILGGFLIIETIFLLAIFNVVDFIGGILIALFSFLLSRKVQYRYSNETNYFFHNFTVTLKGVLNHYRVTSSLMSASEKLFIYSILLMAIQQFLLSWLSLTSILFSVGYYGMLLGIILNLSKRKTLLISKGLVLYSIMLLIMTLQNVFGSFHYQNYHTVISLFIFWYLAGFFHSLNIQEVHINKSNINTEIKNYQ